MSKNFLLIIYFLFALSGSSNSIQSNLDSISSLINLRNYEAAKSLALGYKILNDKKANYLWLTKSNYFLGYINRTEGDFGKAIIYYLEAIRYAKNASYEGVELDITSLYYRCGVIFTEFKAYSLAEEYYLKGIELARLYNNKELELDINFRLGILFERNERYSEAIKLFSANLLKIKTGTSRYSDFSNRLAIAYRKSGLFNEAIETSKKLIDKLSKNDSKNGSFHHTLAKSYRESKDYTNALISYSKAIEVKSLNKSKKSLFSSYFGLAETYYGLNDYVNSKSYFELAETLIALQPKHPDYFEIYKSLADLNYSIKNYKKSKHYEDLYSNSLNEYLNVQAEIQEADKRYNMDLITKRYFAEVDKQERIADILMYSKLTSGGLLTLLLLVIGYHRYQKIRLRKSIERELIALGIVE